MMKKQMKPTNNQCTRSTVDDEKTALIQDGTWTHRQNNYIMHVTETNNNT